MARTTLYVTGALLTLAVPLVFSEFLVGLFAFIGILAIAVLGLVVLTGAGGLASFGQAAFMGIGAYATAYYTTAWGGSPWIGLLLSLGASGIIAYILGSSTLRLEGHFLPLSTVAWGIAIYYLFGGLTILGRNTGLSGIPPISLFGFNVVSAAATYYFVAVVLILAMVACANLLDSRPGRAIRGLKGGRVLVESIGISVFRTRLAAFIICGMLAGLSGWLFAHTERFVSPMPFDMRPGIELVFMALVGGASSIWGAVLGSAIVVLFKDTLQDILPYLSDRSAQLEIVVFGVAFVALLHRANNGLVPWIVRLFDKPARATKADAASLPKRQMPQRGSRVLDISGVTKKFGGLTAVNAVTAHVDAGEILGVIGPNGAGKSTLFNLISSVAPVTSGTISFLGSPTNDMDARAIAKAGIARTFQHVKLIAKMTVLENVALGCYMRTSAGFLSAMTGLDSATEAAIFRQAHDQLVRVGLAEKENLLAESLSLGEQRILEIARALATDPVLLLLDEPAAGLRHMEKQSLARLLTDLRAEGLSILLVEHDMQFVMSLVDRIVVVDFGNKIAEGLPYEIRRNARVKEAYLGVEYIGSNA